MGPWRAGAPEWGGGARWMGVSIDVRYAPASVRLGCDARCEGRTGRNPARRPAKRQAAVGAVLRFEEARPPGLRLFGESSASSVRPLFRERGKQFERRTPPID